MSTVPYLKAVFIKLVVVSVLRLLIVLLVLVVLFILLIVLIILILIVLLIILVLVILVVEHEITPLSILVLSESGVLYSLLNPKKLFCVLFCNA